MDVFPSKEDAAKFLLQHLVVNLDAKQFKPLLLLLMIPEADISVAYEDHPNDSRAAFLSLMTGTFLENGGTVEKLTEALESPVLKMSQLAETLRKEAHLLLYPKSSPERGFVERFGEDLRQNHFDSQSIRRKPWMEKSKRPFTLDKIWIDPILNEIEKQGFEQKIKKYEISDYKMLLSSSCERRRLNRILITGKSITYNLLMKVGNRIHLPKVWMILDGI